MPSAEQLMARVERVERRRSTQTEPLDEALSSTTLWMARRSDAPADAKSLLEWALRVPEPKVGRLDFDEFPFQPEIYDVFGGGYRNVVVRKATQVGASSLMVRWALHEADVNGRTVMYIFPTQSDVFDWGDTRIAPLFEQEYLMNRMGDPFNKALKRVGAGYVFFRGSESKRKLDSVDADAIAFDEYDTLNQANLGDAERRLSSPLSPGLVRRVGVPSLPEFGISEQYDQSDRRKWLVRCENKACKGFVGRDRESGDLPLRVPDKLGGWQELDFWRNVVWEEDGKRILNVRRVCENCGGLLNVGKGRWVAQQPDSDTPGFHLSRLLAPNAHLESIVRASKRTAPFEVEVFYNKDLGLPFVSKVARLSSEEVAACCRDEVKLEGAYTGSKLVTMGVDVASERALNVRISEHLDDETKRALWIGEVEDTEDGFSAFDNLALLMNRFRVNMAVIDHLPETRLGRAFIEKFPGRVFFGIYSWNQRDPLVVDDAMRTATVRRTIALDATVEMVRRQRNLLPRALPEGYVAHMTANIRKIERDELDQVKVFWFATRPDDYFQAEVYDLLATELYYRRVLIEEESREVLQPLDDILPFQRSSIDRYDEQPDYQAGPSEGGESMYGS